MEDIWQHPQLKARGRWTRIATPCGDVPALLPPGLDTSNARMGAGPGVGQHTEAVMTELGLNPPDSARLRSAGVI